ncbi:MAG: hypothetical protein ACR2JY_15735 [Chloroflexota bacterium]
MAMVSQLELPGSPTEQASAGATTYYWDPTAELAAGETISNPVVLVLEYDPRYPADTKDVTATVAAAGSPFLGRGANAGQVGVTIPANVLVAGYEYRVQLSVLASGGHAPVRFFRLRCQL